MRVSLTYFVTCQSNATTIYLKDAFKRSGYPDIVSLDDEDEQQVDLAPYKYVPATGPTLPTSA